MKWYKNENMYAYRGVHFNSLVTLQAVSHSETLFQGRSLDYKGEQLNVKATDFKWHCLINCRWLRQSGGEGPANKT